MSDTASVAVPSSGRAFPVTSVVTWVLCILTLGPFLVYPVVRVLMGALVQDGQFAPSLLLLPVNDPSAREAMLNSFMIGVAATILSRIINQVVGDCVVWSCCQLITRLTIRKCYQLF